MEWNHECLWYATSAQPCDDDQVFKRLILRDNSLRGTIPEELTLISNLGTLLFPRTAGAEQKLTGWNPACLQCFHVEYECAHAC